MSLSVQFLSLLAMIGTGIVSAAFLDLIGMGIMISGKKSLIRRRAAWLEGIGWVLVGCWTFYILFLVRDGAWRIYDPFAQLSGMLLYVSFFHKPFRLIGRVVAILFVKPLWYLVRFIVSIIKGVFQVIIKIIAFLFKPFVKIIRKYFRKPFNKMGK